MAKSDVLDELTPKERDGVRLRIARRRFSLTQRELGERAHCSTSLISQLETGRTTRPIKFAILSAIAGALHRSIADVFPDTMEYYHLIIADYLSYENKPEEDVDFEKLAKHASRCA
jgi:transcriptional regulator with XRE-family HTH domain